MIPSRHVSATDSFELAQKLSSLYHQGSYVVRTKPLDHLNTSICCHCERFSLCAGTDAGRSWSSNDVED